MHGITYIGKVFKDFYNDINWATLTGAIDVIVVEQPDGTYNCSPFHVRFGKLGVLRSREKVVEIEINGEPQNIFMKLGESGEAFFVEELEEHESNEIPDHLATSPIPVSEIESIFKTQSRRRSLDLGQEAQSIVENEVNDYSKRRNTADNENPKTRERNFIKRQIGLGNIDVIENSTEDLTLSRQSITVASTRASSEDVSKINDASDTIFKMDSLEYDGKSEPISTTPVKDSSQQSNTNSKSSKRKRRKMKKKNAPRKSTSTNQLSTNSDIQEKSSDDTTERSSLGSTSDPEIKEIQKYDDSTPTTARKVIDPEFHFFSDTEITATGAADAKNTSPLHLENVQSDSEFEVQNRKDDNSANRQSWEWGGFPQQTQSETDSGISKEEEQKMSMISSMFSFMKTKHVNQRCPDEMYLSDLSSGNIDPEVAAIYFTQTKDKSTDADMDCESGNGPSLAQSPNSIEGSKSIDSDFDEHNKQAQTSMDGISLSLCGWEPEPTEDRFMENLVSFSDLCNNAMLIENHNLVVKIRDKFYNWKVASPLIASLMIYQRPLPESTLEQLCSAHMPSTSMEKNNNKQQPNPQERYSWWSWRRGRSREATPALEIGKIPKEELKINSPDEAKDDSTKSDATDDSTSKDFRPITESIDDPNTSLKINMSDKCRKTLRLSSKQIAMLNLKDGMNEVEFSVTTAYQGTTRCKCHLYKWKWDDKIVISDIDGTITKSDVLGHILPIVGKDWAQSGVAQLFNKISDNGYKLLYLSARAIGQARTTREYLKSIKQGDLTMPDGPVLLNPTSLILAFHREVIEKKPEQFKISCMSDIKCLFPTDSNPFYAGYGNRINDVWAYRAVGIPIVRIFTINPKGELKHELTQTFQSSYSIMSNIVDHLFPPRVEAANDFSQFTYWRDPVQAAEDLPELT